ncbi:hypothetical protein B0T21DRAFT_106880 [Apiosordaria backusii]|uniref:Uncharacterized protein n=1 Tax=Apiosordaria backusii TaxID=314023 RepID=A0AA39ZV22_9PEZI|nr:hypothetical protein B0T21DRAFT_106880 [Apiosordaria backusii]
MCAKSTPQLKRQIRRKGVAPLPQPRASLSTSLGPSSQSESSGLQPGNFNPKPTLQPETVTSLSGYQYPRPQYMAATRNIQHQLTPPGPSDNPASSSAGFSTSRSWAIPSLSKSSDTSHGVPIADMGLANTGIANDEAELPRKHSALWGNNVDSAMDIDQDTALVTSDVMKDGMSGNSRSLGNAYHGLVGNSMYCGFNSMGRPWGLQG